MHQKFPMTRSGFERLEEELKHLRNVERPDVLLSIAEARQHGDLSENAEYHAAKERQGLIEARINYLENRINCAEVIDVSKLSGDRILFGAKVVLTDEDKGVQKNYQIVGSDEADVEKGLLSITSPLGRTLIGRKMGDSIEVNTPSGLVYYTINKVMFN